MCAVGQSGQQRQRAAVAAAALKAPHSHIARLPSLLLLVLLLGMTVPALSRPEAVKTVLCGPKADGKRCPSGQCCSKKGTCGTGTAFCSPDNCFSSCARAPPPPPPPKPFKWVALSPKQRKRAEQLLSIFENSSLRPAYGYAENLRDDRGVTFGRSGFCTGTSDGLQVVRAYVKAKPRSNPLAPFLPTLERIDAQGGGDSPLLQGANEKKFISAVKAAASDPLFRQAQDEVASRLYFAPSQQLAKSLGLSLALSKAQLYDAYVQHGFADKDTRDYPVSANGMADRVSKKLGGSPLQGVGEALWLGKYLELRGAVLRSNGGTWRAGAQRVDIYRWLQQANNTALSLPMRLSYEKCRPDGQPGPCKPQARRGEVSLGGVVYGDFFIQ